MKHKKLIIWGALSDTGHTNSFVHAGMYKAAKHIGIECHWVDNRHNLDPEFFDDAIIFTEQWLAFKNGYSNKLPLRNSSTYIVHYLGNKGNVEGNPSHDMYIGKVKKLIEYRFMCDWGINGVEDKNWVYKFDKSKCDIITDGASYYEKDDLYDKFYAFWATDLLPEEINFDDRFIEFKNPKYAFFGGSIRNNQQVEDGNIKFIEPFAKKCVDNDIAFFHNCPFRNPISFEQMRSLVSQSYLPFDCRPKNHIANGYVPCRSIKNVSYGQIVMTNSKAVHDFFDGDFAYSNDPDELFDIAIQMQNDKNTKNKILKHMHRIKEKHTYVNRIKDMIYAAVT